MLEELIADCLKVLSLSFSLMSSSSEVRLNLLFQFMVGAEQSAIRAVWTDSARAREEGKGLTWGPEDLCVLHCGAKFFGQLIGDVCQTVLF